MTDREPESVSPAEAVQSQRCPYLGSAGNRTAALSEPSSAHRCYAQRPPGGLDAVHQRAYCLTAAHTACSLYVDPASAQAAAGVAPEEPETRPRVRLLTLLPWLALLAVVTGVGAVYARDLLRQPPPATPLIVEMPTPTGAVQAPAGATPAQTVPTATESRAIIEPTREPTVTPAPGGSVLTLEPGAGETGWWASGDKRGEHLGDSYLYAGYFDGKAIVSAMQFDLRRVRRGAPIEGATLTLTGLDGQRLGPGGGDWRVQFIDPAALPESPQDKGPDLARADFQALYNAPAAVTLFPALFPADLAAGTKNTFVLDDEARAWLAQQVLDGRPAVVARIVGPGGGIDTLFAWDSGAGPQTRGYPPQLALTLGAPPATPPPLPTEQVIVATETPTPANVLTAAARESQAGQGGTPTSLPYALATPTLVPMNVETVQAARYAAGLPPLVIYTPTPANASTAAAAAAYATAVAVTTGTFTPAPTDAVTPVVVLPTPIPGNVATAAAQLLAATAQARERGTVTPLPFGIVVATTTPEAPVVASTPTPGNAATARANSVDATAVAITTGTFTPVPRGARTPTPGPTATPLPLIVAITPRPTPSPTPTPPGQAPRQLAGKILFRSDREGVERFYALDPATGRLYWITQAWPFEVAQSAEGRGSDGRRAEVQTVTEITSTDPYTGAWSGSRSTAAIFVLDDRYKTQKQITTMDRFSYDPAWSPGGEWIAFVSTEGGNDEIFLIRPDGSDLRRLTTNTWEWDKHPTWSPDGSQIVFWSNRESGRRQLWIMNADGSNPRELLESPYNDWDPIWVK